MNWQIGPPGLRARILTDFGCTLAVLLALCLMERGEAGRGIAQHGLIRDRVAAVDALGLVADHLHRRLAIDADPSEIPHRRSPEVVGDLSHETCALGSVYGFLQGAWPFGLVEAVWTGVAARRWWVATRAS